MSLPLMPKGVEHAEVWQVPHVLVAVSLPLMPKGVEHNVAATWGTMLFPVSLPLMPKGVEHAKLDKLLEQGKVCPFR